MRSFRGLFILGLVVFIASLIALFPARVAIGWIAPPELMFSEIDGTVWRGSAAEASLDGFYLSDIEWSTSPMALFFGKLNITLAAKPVSGFVDTNASIALSGDVKMTNFSAALPLGLFADAAGVPGLDGNASLAFERLVLVDGLAVVADGEINIANLQVPVLGRDSLGAYAAEFRTQNNGIVAAIEDTDGVIDLAGSLQIRSDRSFEFIGQVVVTSRTPQTVRQQLKFLPPPNERGQQELRLEGVL